MFKFGMISKLVEENVIMEGHGGILGYLQVRTSPLNNHHWLTSLTMGVLLTESGIKVFYTN